MTLSQFNMFNRLCSVTMLNRCLVLSKFVNQSLKLNALPSSMCIRQYAMTYDEEEREKKIKQRVMKVNLIMPDQKVSSMTFEQAERLAKRRDLVMTKLVEPPKFASYGGRDVYEMATKAQHIKESSQSLEVDEANTKQDYKEKKTLTFSATIAEHDMQVKLKKIQKWLSKHHIVFVIIADDGTGASLKEKVTLVETEFKAGSKVSIVTKKRQALLTIVPLNKPANQPASSTCDKKTIKEKSEQESTAGDST